MTTVITNDAQYQAARLEAHQLSRAPSNSHDIDYCHELTAAITAYEVAKENALFERDQHMPDETRQILPFLDWEGLPKEMAEIAQPFGELAGWMVETVPDNLHRTEALKRLMEARDYAVRAFVCETASR